jgi:hypothetical protein
MLYEASVIFYKILGEKDLIPRNKTLWGNSPNIMKGTIK